MWSACLVAPLTYSFSTKANMTGRWVTVGWEKEKTVFFNPRPEQRRPNLEFKGRELLERLSHYSGIATSNVICLPADDRGPAVSDLSPGWQEAGAAGSGARHFPHKNAAMYPPRLTLNHQSCTEMCDLSHQSRWARANLVSAELIHIRPCLFY